MTAPDPRALRSAFGTFMTGVTVVTSAHPDGTPLGFTANSFTSVSLDPPLVLVCLAKTSNSYASLTQAGGFAVNVLAETQTDISNVFAKPVEDRFAGIEWQKGPVGSPVLAGVSAWFDCKMNKIVEAGDHIVLFGEVGAFDSTAHPGLGYARGAYFTPSSAVEALEPDTNLIVSALIERAGEVLLIEDETGGLALPETRVAGQSAADALAQLIAATGLQAEPGFIYSVFDDTARKRHHISFLCQTASGTPARGRFVPLDPTALDAVTDPAAATMLKRLAAENRIGRYGIYYGDHLRGEVRPLTQER